MLIRFLRCKGSVSSALFVVEAFICAGILIFGWGALDRAGASLVDVVQRDPMKAGWTLTSADLTASDSWKPSGGVPLTGILDPLWLESPTSSPDPDWDHSYRDIGPIAADLRFFTWKEVSSGDFSMEGYYDVRDFHSLSFAGGEPADPGASGSGGIQDSPSLVFSGHIQGTVGKTVQELLTVKLQGTLCPPPSSVPLPGSAWLIGSGLTGLIGAARFLRNRRS